MRRRLSIKLLTALFAVALAGKTGLAQQSEPALFEIADDGKWQKTDTTHRLAQFPKIHPDGRIWIQFEAPTTAKSVQVHIDGKDLDLQKDAAGRWNVLLSNIDPGFQIYWMLVDGARAIDPGNQPFFVNGYVSAIDVPSPGEEYYRAKKDVPHGDVREHWFYCTVTDSMRRMYVYAPPGYEKDTGARYPVLYLQHGGGELEDEWVHAARANFILDNLIAEKKARPMMIVMNLGFADKPGEAQQGRGGRGARDGAGAQGGAGGRGPAPAPNVASTFEEMLINEVIPNIDASYRTMADQKHRAMAGLSRGGNQTLTIAPKHLETFSHIGVFSGVPNNYADLLRGATENAPAFNEKVKVLWFGAGAMEPAFLDRQKAAEELLTKSGVKAQYYVSNGTAHEWQTWRRCLHQFAPLLFQN